MDDCTAIDGFVSARSVVNAGCYAQRTGSEVAQRRHGQGAAPAIYSAPQKSVSVASARKVKRKSSVLGAGVTSGE